ncbi:unnamed protein product [Fraxinus pennsylvanica]|uniref:Lipoyl-binding domain-containing protein n=1 Tax=Fraxinus pennsylvanica TaxID=56036 RepID=A0AAD2AE15_9LAMI|nr:unnamed protein product [Fraxinus pennsylvanica]
MSLRPIREVVGYLQQDVNTQIWSSVVTSHAANCFPFFRYMSKGDLVEAVIPHMGESITDCTLATFLRKPGDRVEVDEPIAQVETDKVTVDVNSLEAGVIQKLIAKEGDIVAPGTKIAVISKSGEGVTHVAPSDEKPSEKADPSPLSPAEEKEEKPKPKVETMPVVEKLRESSLPSKSSDTEPLLPPEERERRVPMTRLRN